MKTTNSKNQKPLPTDVNNVNDFDAFMRKCEIEAINDTVGSRERALKRFLERDLEPYWRERWEEYWSMRGELDLKDENE